jgi:hypothetical protein
MKLFSSFIIALRGGVIYSLLGQLHQNTIKEFIKNEE